ncbi:chemotaxis protein CheB [Pedobacter hiemivivus]|uniref:protein-glutamate methylesterase n=1 Tax=Pedobacter hiemivivus TaxID=2530454 RepID=A0A4V2MHR7_9SPHI|nr:chemotaxis protein CheB [Pedobacter hiemivivus]TCC87426.1 chemotaxis protein CheB [Pedobacter hiemivivus]
MSGEKTSGKKSKIKHIVVIGASAGGLKALSGLVSQLPLDFPAPLLIVQHISADASGDVLLNSLKQHGRLPCQHARSGDSIKPGNIYLAPSDHHMLVDKGDRLLITKGAAENRSRPGIDPLFRSAAIHYRNKTIGIILTGYLDDGTSGLSAVQRCGGITIVQDPKDAEYPDMPENALNQMKVDYCIPLAEIGSILVRLASTKTGGNFPVPQDLLIEGKIAERVVSDLNAVNTLGDQVPFNCPGCGGVLWQIETKGSKLRFRCHVGHAYTAASLLAEQTSKIEETMWTALRMFEEKRNLLTTMAKSQTGAPAKMSKERTTLMQVHIERIRTVLLADDKATRSDTPK